MTKPPVFRPDEALEVGRFDDWKYDLTLSATDLTTGTDAPLTTSNVTAHVSLWPPSLTALPSSSVALTHLASGRWIGGRDVNDMTAALAGVRDGTPLAIVYVVDGAMARYRDAVAVTMRRSEAA